MLLLGIDRVSTAVKVVQAELLRNQIDSLPKGELIEHTLEFPEEVIRL